MPKLTYEIEVAESKDNLLWISVYQVGTTDKRSLIDSRTYGSLDDGLFWARAVILDFIGHDYA
jgi:hypothetical protein